MFTFIKTDFTKALLGRLANSNDTKTTLLGLAAGGVLAANLDWAKLFHGDSAEIGKATGAIVVALLGYYANKPDKKTVI